MKRGLQIATGLFGAATAAYGTYVALTYARYGRLGAAHDRDVHLDRYMPEPEVREVHQIDIAAPADIAFDAVRSVSMNDSTIVRSLIELRTLPTRLLAESPEPRPRKPFLEEIESLGWGRLEEEPRRRMVFGAVTQPWLAQPEFRALPAERFASFREPGFARIIWTIEVEPIGGSISRFRTETRVDTTDAVSRERFRRYWSLLSPGIIAIRYEMLRLVKTEAERHVGMATAAPTKVEPIGHPRGTI